MRRSRLVGGLILTGILTTSPVTGQNSPADYRDAFLDHFEQSSYKITELARVMPEEKYTWAPGEGVMTVAQVYTHLARYNFMYLDQNLGIKPPRGMEYMGLEDITDKAEVRQIFELSVAHVKEKVAAMTESALSDETDLYGRQVSGWTVLLQLISHMNEHVGQSVAYARMNGMVPPWSS